MRYCPGRLPRLLAIGGIAFAALVTALTPEVALAAAQPAHPPIIDSPGIRESGHWQRTSDARYPAELFPSESYSCPAWRRRWLAPDGASVAVAIWTCHESNDSAAALWELMFLNSASIGVKYSYAPLAQDHDAWVRSLPPGPATGGQRETQVWLARSRYLIVAAARTPAFSVLTSEQLASRVLLQEAALLRGPEHHLSAPPLIANAFSTLIAAIVTACLLIILPIRYARNPLKGQRYEVRESDARWTDVTSRARRLKWSARFRALMRVLFFFALAGIIVSRHLSAGACAWLALAAWFGWIRPVGRTLRAWRPRRVRGLYLSHNKQAWLEPVFATASLGLSVAAALVCLTDIFVYALGLANSPLVVGGVLDPRYLNSIPQWLELTVTLLVAIPEKDLFQVTSFVIVLLLAAAAVLRRFGRRFALADAVIAQEKDHRPPVLYLRNFSDDVLRMPSSSLARTSLTERLSIARLQPFEEILVRHLRTVGPVIALAPPGARLPALGAARVVRSNDSWKDQIREWADSAAVVVVAATPREVSPGLTWEIEFLAKEATKVPVVLAISPYKRKAVELRWRRFCHEAVNLPRFGGLVSYIEHNSGAHFLTQRDDLGWTAWGARMRSEFTYAVALAEAVSALRENGTGNP